MVRGGEILLHIPPRSRLFKQPLVPMAAAATGRWLFEETDGGKGGSIVMKPGGHGALWKLCHDEGVMDWLPEN